MTETVHTIGVDAEAWSRAERQAADTGKSAEDVVQESLRRGLAGTVLAELRARVRRRAPLDESAAVQLAAAERRTMLADRAIGG